MGLQAAPAYIGTGSYAHPATLDRAIIKQFSGRKSGVFGSGDFVVAPAAGLNVTIQPGAATMLGVDIPATQGHYFAWSDAVETFAVVPPHASLKRVDALILRVVDTSYAGGYTSGALWQWISGTAASTPTAPTDADIQAGGNYRPGSWLRVANVQMNNGDTTPDPTRVTDTRLWTTSASGMMYATSVAARPTLNLAKGDMVYHLDTGSIYFYTGTTWLPIDGSLVCEVNKAAAQSIPAAFGALTFDTTVDDTYNMHPGSGTGITVPVAGRYWVGAAASTGAQPGGVWDFFIGKNGVNTKFGDRRASAAGSNNFIALSGEIKCAANDVLTVRSAITGGATNSLGGETFIVRFVGP